MKKIKLIIEDNKKGKVVIAITQKQIRTLYDLAFLLDDEETEKHLKDNNCYKEFCELHKIGATAIDAIDEGGCFILINNKMIKIKHKYYHAGKKPKWKM